MDIDCLKKKLKKDYELHWFKQLWIDRKDGHNKRRSYRKFKKDFVLEKYMDLSDPKLRRATTKFRISNHNLGIETGRQNTPPPQFLWKIDCAINVLWGLLKMNIIYSYAQNMLI